MVSTNFSNPGLWSLVDCNCFYASCERLFRPDLKDKPVAVLSNNDGCIVAMSPETKALGYKMGDVYFKLKHQLKRDGVEVFSSNYALYGDISRRVMETLRTFATIEQYSIDECFVPFGPAMEAQADAVGKTLHDIVMQWVGVPVRVGIGSTRTLAKFANLWAKKISRVLRLEADMSLTEELLAQTPTGDVWGIGRRQSAKLARHGITTALQLRDMDLDYALKLLTVVGQRTVLELRGTQCIMQNELPTPRKTLVSSRSFGRAVTRKGDLAQALAMHCSIVGRRLREEGLEACHLSIHCSTSPHAYAPYQSIGGRVRLSVPTNITGCLIEAANQVLEKCYQTGLNFMKSGILLSEISEVGKRQLTLIEACEDSGAQRKTALMETLDRVNDRYGRDTLKYLSEGPKDAFWHMRRELMSPLMTTSWENLPSVS